MVCFAFSLLLCSLQQKLQLELGPQQVACNTSASTSSSTSSNSTSSSESSSGQPSTASAEQGQQQQQQNQQQQRLHKGLPLPVFLPDAELDQLVQPLARWVCLLKVFMVPCAWIDCSNCLRRHDRYEFTCKCCYPGKGQSGPAEDTLKLCATNTASPAPYGQHSNTA